MEGLGILATMPILDLLEPAPPKPVTGPMPRCHEIQMVLAKAYGITLADMKGKCRARKFAVPRQIAATLCRELTNNSLPQIGRMFGNRDHTTILFAMRKISQRESVDQKFADEMEDHRRAISEVVANREPSPPFTPPTKSPDEPSHRWAMRNKRQRMELAA